VSEERDLLRQTVAALVEKHASPAAVREAMASERGYDESLWKLLCEQVGAAALVVPAELGGAGGELADAAVVLEELGKALVPTPLLGTTLAELALLAAIRTGGAPDSETIERLAEGTSIGAVVFDPGFANDLGKGVPGSLLQSYAQAVVSQWTRETGRAGAAGRAGPFGAANAVTIVPQVRMRFNPTRESKNLFVPGLMAFVLTIISSLMTAISLTREKETGTMEALLVSPLRPWEIIAGKVLPYLAVGFGSLLLVLVEARFVFAVPMRGSVLLLLAEGLLYVLVSLAFGILISARTSSQRLAMMGVFLTTLLPNVLLSGFIFPVESMPAVLQWISFVFPGRWFVVIARGIMLKGVGVEYLWRETLYIALLAVVLLAASVRSFRERLE